MEVDEKTCGLLTESEDNRQLAAISHLMIAACNWPGNITVTPGKPAVCRSRLSLRLSQGLPQNSWQPVIMRRCRCACACSLDFVHWQRTGSSGPEHPLGVSKQAG